VDAAAEAEVFVVLGVGRDADGLDLLCAASPAWATALPQCSSAIW
jgi:hypothetical protein